MELIFLVFFLTFPIWWGWLFYHIGRYGLPFELRRRQRVDRRERSRLHLVEQEETEIFRA